MSERSMGEWMLYFDGLTEPVNPGGVMAWGWVLVRSDGTRVDGRGFKPRDAGNTNNIAEWTALGRCLRAIHDGAVKPSSLVIYGDSQLVCRQLNGEWKCRAEHMAALRDRCHELLRGIGATWRVEWVPREKNAEADELSRAAYRDCTGQDPPTR